MGYYKPTTAPPAVETWVQDQFDHVSDALKDTVLPRVNTFANDITIEVRRGFDFMHLMVGAGHTITIPPNLEQGYRFSIGGDEGTIISHPGIIVSRPFDKQVALRTEHSIVHFVVLGPITVQMYGDMLDDF